MTGIGEGSTRILTPISENTERYTFRDGTGTQTINIKNYTWGLYVCDRCGEETKSMNEKGEPPKNQYNHNCNRWWIIDRKNRGIFLLKKVVG